MKLNLLVVAATGGLGQQIVKESLSRGHSVSVLVRDEAKLKSLLPQEASKLNQIFVGDATDASTVAKSVQGKDVVICSLGAHLPTAKTVAEQSKAANVSKMVFVAGLTNVLSEDGSHPYWQDITKQYPPAERSYNAHKVCIDAIQATGINNVIFCPGYMKSVGGKSKNPTIRVNRPVGMFVSYEDAASVMVDAAESDKWDGQHVAASTEVKDEL